jgi:hypothetical protein
LRQQLAYALARAGDHEQAMLVVADLEKPASRKGESLYELGCISALASAAAAQDMRLSASARQKRAESHALQAIRLLKAAFADKKFLDSLRKNAHIHEDHDLDSLRERDDFKQLLETVNK